MEAVSEPGPSDAECLTAEHVLHCIAILSPPVFLFYLTTGTGFGLLV